MGVKLEDGLLYLFGPEKVYIIDHFGGSKQEVFISWGDKELEKGVND
jgi:hypothetical protein